MTLGFRARTDALQRFELRRGAWALGTLADDGSTTDLLDLAGAGVTVYAVAGAGAVDLQQPRRLVLRLCGPVRTGCGGGARAAYSGRGRGGALHRHAAHA